MSTAKVQKTVRIDQDLVNAARVLSEKNGISMDKLVERALVLSMEEYDDLPVRTNQLRFMVDNCTKEQQRKVRQMLTLLAAEALEIGTPSDRLFRGFILDWLKLVTEGIPISEVMEIYGRYGKNKKPPPSKNKLPDSC